MRLLIQMLATVGLTAVVCTVSAAEHPKGVSAFLDQHCYDCHDDTVKKGSLNLLDLSFDPDNASNFKLWQRVFERVRDGEMPPEDEPQPDKKDAEMFLAELKKPLLEVDLAKAETEGRVLSRRLTRREYEYTVQDLLGIGIPFTELLPEDPASHGFETVADGQQLSHHNLARYLDVADLALAEAFDRALKGDEPFKKVVTPEMCSKRTRGNYRGPELRDGRSISWPITLQFFGRIPETTVPKDGWYRITIKDVQAVNPGEDGAVWGTLNSGTCYSNAPMLYMIGLIEATSQPRDIVYEAWIREDHMLELKPNDATLKRAPTGATGGNVSFEDRDLKKQGFEGIAHRGIEIERIYPMGSRKMVKETLFGKDGLEGWESKPKAGLKTLVKDFASRAFRRPVTEELVGPYQEIGLASLEAGDSLAESLRSSYRAILCSPRFLTLLESPGQLDDYALASRLSYALWVSMPDEQLLKVAQEGKLSKPWALSKQIDRMLDDPKADRFVKSFTDQWLKLKEIDFTTPDRGLYPEFDPVLQQSMLEETRAFFAQLVKDDLAVKNLVDSKFSMLNGRLARHYRADVDLKIGEGLQRIALPEANQARGGLVTHGAILKVTADGTSTSPVVRGVFVNERILGMHIPPPPPNVPAIEPDIRGATSIRDQLDKHRSNESCAACHAKIDPPGFVLEQFDPIGMWRKNYGRGGKGVAVDPSGVTPDGAEFGGITGWKRIYTEREPQLAKGFASQLLTYGTGAAIRFSDEEALDRVVAEAGKSGYGVRSLIHASLKSRIFTHK